MAGCIPTNPIVSNPQVSSHESSSFHIYFLDVGQADCAVIESDGHYVLVDGGNKGDSSLLYSFVKKMNITNFDYIVASHVHEDHIGGIPGALQYASANTTLCPTTSFDSNVFEDFKKYVDLNGGGITVPSVGDVYTFGNASMTIVAVNSGEDLNDTSIIFRLDIKGLSALFTGDGEHKAEQAALNSGISLKADLLKVGHHGSDTSTSYLFLREVMPSIAVISVGQDNIYGLPNQSTLDKLEDAEVTTYRTDLQGDITCTIENGSFVCTTEKNTQETTTVPTDITYVINASSKKFHLPTCPSVNDINECNRIDTELSREELIEKGYTPCKRCNP